MAKELLEGLWGAVDCMVWDNLFSPLATDPNWYIWWRMNKRAKGHTHTYIYTYIFMCQARVVCFSVLLQDRARELARLLQERPGVLRSFLATRYGREWRSEIEPYTKTKFLGYERLGKELAKTNSRYNKALGDSEFSDKHMYRWEKFRLVGVILKESRTLLGGSCTSLYSCPIKVTDLALHGYPQMTCRSPDQGVS